MSDRALTRLEEARQRAHSPTRSHLRLHPQASVDIYIACFRDLAELAKLRVTEAGDREAIQAHYNTRIAELQAELIQVEHAIKADYAAFDALRKDNKEIVQVLLKMGEVEAAIQLQTRFFQQFGASTLDKLLKNRHL